MTAGAARGSGGRRVGVQLGALLAAAALSNVAYTILIPFVPMLQSRFGMGAVAVGLAFGGFAAAKALAQPFGGWAVDRLCARTVAVAGLILAAIATAALATAERALEVIGHRLLWGVGEGFAIPALYRLASTLGSRSVYGKARVLGWFGSAAVVGMTLGPGMIAIFANTLTFRTAFALGAALTGGAAAVLACTVERDLGQASAPHPGATPPTGEAHPVGATASGPRLLLPVVIGFGLLDFVNNFVYAALEPILPIYSTATLGLDARTVSILFFVGLAAFAAFAAVAGPVVERHGERAAATAALIVQVGALAAAWAVATAGVLAVSFVLLMVSQPVVYVAARSGITAVPASHQGKAFGIFGLISDFGWVAGPLVTTALFTVVGGTILLLLAVLAVIPALWMLAGRRRAVRTGAV